jgi:hypothetical protein
MARKSVFSVGGTVSIARIGLLALFMISATLMWMLSLYIWY